MRITNELRAKIDRAFNDKKNKRLAELRKEADAIRAKVAEDFTEYLKMLRESDIFPAQFAETIVAEVCEYGEKTDEIAARKLAGKFSNEELERNWLESNQAKIDSDREKEEFLIAVSYAGGDISSIKEVFAQYGITF